MDLVVKYIFLRNITNLPSEKSGHFLFNASIFHFWNSDSVDSIVVKDQLERMNVMVLFFLPSKACFASKPTGLQFNPRGPLPHLQKQHHARRFGADT